MVKRQDVAARPYDFQEENRNGCFDRVARLPANSYARENGIRIQLINTLYYRSLVVCGLRMFVDVQGVHIYI